MSPTDACTIITSTFGVASRSSVPAIGASSSRRVRGSNRVPVARGAPGSLRESGVACRAPSLRDLGSPWPDGSVVMALSGTALLGGCAGPRAAARGCAPLISSDCHAPGASASLRYPPRLPSLLASIGWFSFLLLYSAAHALALV